MVSAMIRYRELSSWGIRLLVSGCVMTIPAFAQHRLHNEAEGQTAKHPWMDASLSPDQRADMVLKEMTLDEKIDLVHGQGYRDWEFRSFR